MYRSYSYGGGVNSAQPEDVATKIRELTKDFCTAFNTGNHDHAAALFQAEGLFMAPGTDPVQGRKAIEAKLREFAEHGYHNLRLETTRVECSGDVAIEVGRYTVSIARSSADAVDDRGKYLTVWRRLGAWLIVGDCWSSSIPKMIPGVMEMPLGDKNKTNPVIGQNVPKSA